MIAGSTNAGKTTLLRALANEIPPHERLITVERALELGLDEFPDLHPNVVAFEERLPNSEGQGRISMAELVRRSLRMNPSRVIVGEVLGDEIVTMLNAMSQGNDGSLSTIHANSSSEVFNRIATYALQAAEHLPIEASHMLIAGAINFVVFIQRRNDYREGGGLRRYVASIREVNGVDGRVVSSEIWAPGRDGRARPAASIQCLADLEAGRLPAGRLRQVGRMISSDLLLALLGGAIVGGGLLLFVAALVGWAPADRPGPLAVATGSRRATSAAGSPSAPAPGRARAAGQRLAGGRDRGRRCSASSPARCSAAPPRAAPRWPTWRRWRPGRSRCGTRSPARSAWSRRSRRRTTRPRRC